MTVHYLMRHYIAEDNIARRLGGNSPIAQPWASIQHNEIFGFFRNLHPGVTIETIYTSPLLRAKQTAKLLQKDLSKVYQLEPRLIIKDALREQNFGVKEGKIYKDQDSNINRLWDNEFEGADSPDKTLKDLEPFVKTINRRKEPSLIVGHNLNLRALTSLLIPETSDYHLVMKFRNGDIYAYNNDNPRMPLLSPVHIAQTFHHATLKATSKRLAKKSAKARADRAQR